MNTWLCHISTIFFSPAALSGQAKPLRVPESEGAVNVQCSEREPRVYDHPSPRGFTCVSRSCTPALPLLLELQWDRRYLTEASVFLKMGNGCFGSRQVKAMLAECPPGWSWWLDSRHLHRPPHSWSWSWGRWMGLLIRLGTPFLEEQV